MPDIVLIADDDQAVLTMLYKVVRSNGIEADTAASGEEALALLEQKPYDLLLLDVNMHGMDGFQVVQAIRRRGLKLPIIIVSGRKEDYDTLYGLDIGADDYVTKPFSPAELTARIDALYRRIGGDGGADTELLTQGPFVMNIRNRTLEKQGERIRLTQVEFSILKLFMQNPGRALSREDILAAVWGPDYEGELKIVDVNIRRLRIKIEDNATTPKYITTVWGFGYKWGA